MYDNVSSSLHTFKAFFSAVSESYIFNIDAYNSSTSIYPSFFVSIKVNISLNSLNSSLDAKYNTINFNVASYNFDELS